MSIFNSLVPQHPLSPIISSLVDWKEGRIRYVWLAEGEVKVLLKNGPKSWADQEENHILEYKAKCRPDFVSWEVMERDPCYVVLTLSGNDQTNELIEADNEVIRIQSLIKPDHHIVSITEHPFDVFDRRMKDMGEGTLPPAIKQNLECMMKSIKDQMDGGQNPIIT